MFYPIIISTLMTTHINKQWMSEAALIIRNVFSSYAADELSFGSAFMLWVIGLVSRLISKLIASLWVVGLRVDSVVFLRDVRLRNIIPVSFVVFSNLHFFPQTIIKHSTWVARSGRNITPWQPDVKIFIIYGLFQRNYQS